MSLANQFSLDGQVALILGGSGRIGSEIALGFAEAGASLIVVGKTGRKVEEIVCALQGGNASAAGICADLTAPRELRQVVDDALRRCGRIDILVNAQGATIRCASEDLERSAFDQAIALNLASVTFACTEVGRAMLGRGSGRIVNIASISAHRGFQGSLLSTIVKHGVLGLTRTLGTEWAARGVRVNAISPGFLDDAQDPEPSAIESRRQMLLRRTPMARFGKYSEIATAALFLASEAASFMAGQTLIVDGGYLAGGFD